MKLLILLQMLERKNRSLSINERRRRLSETNVSEQHLSRYLLAHFQKLENVKRDLGRLPTPGEHFFLQSDKSFNAFTFIPFVAQKEVVKYMYASTYSLSTKVIDAFMELHDKGLIEELTLLISDSMLKRNPKAMDYLQSVAATRANVKICFAWVHAKVTLLKTASHHYVIEGSGNWSENAQYEQYLFACDRDLYRFRESLFNDIVIRHEFD